MENYNTCSTELIDGDGNFNVTGIDQFSKGVQFAECGISYAVVSILGPQSSGKSTLLNFLFGTNFREMNAFNGRSQTTKGIWMAKGDGIDPCTIVMDLEGTDGRERGEDDTAFEKQSALFALAVSDIVLINMWCHDIGREHAANKPLLKIVFQAMARLFTPRKNTLMFVIRDKTSTPLEKLESLLREDTQKIWDSVPKPQAHKNTLLSDFFNFEFVAFSNYEYQKQEFIQQVADLRKRFFHSTRPGGLAKDRRVVIPASGFSFSAQQIWKTIKENKDLNLPTHKVMVATVRCDEIAAQKYSNFIQNQDWLRLEEASHHPHIQGFGRKLNLILGSCFSEYDAEVLYFDEKVRTQKRKHLQDKLLQLVEPAFRSVLGHLRSGAWEQFKETFEKALNAGEGFAVASDRCKQIVLKVFDKGYADSVCEQANWDASKVRSKLVHDIAEHITAIRASKLGELKSGYEAELKETLSEHIGILLVDGNDKTWTSIELFLTREAQSAVSKLDRDLSGFDLDKETRDKMLANLKDYATSLVEAIAKEEAEKASIRMKDRFTRLFKSGKASRRWNGRPNIEESAVSAKAACLRLLSVLAAIRFEGESDDIYETLTKAFDHDRFDGYLSLRESRTWRKVPSSKTLITPIKCVSLLKTFEEETEDTVNQAKVAQNEEDIRRQQLSTTAVAEGMKVVHTMALLGTIIFNLATR